MQVVQRIMLDAARSKTVHVPSEQTFLRVHLPSGQVVILKDPGNLTRVISMASIFRQTTTPKHTRLPPIIPGYTGATTPDVSILQSEELAQDFESASQVARYHTMRAWLQSASPAHQTILPLGSYATARLLSPDRKSIPGISVARGREAHWEVHGDPLGSPYTLQIKRPCGSILEVRLPGDVQRAWARADFLREQSALTFSVRLSTTEPAADTIVGYLQRGDLYSAESMTEWIDEARDILLYKRSDPYAAAVGAYLLLRLKQFSHLHDWARNLADWFDFLPDGCVIWAWQLIHQAPSNREEIYNYFSKAIQRGLPIYSEGLRLLIDGLRLLGDDGQTMLQKVLDQVAVALWNSPLTTSVRTENYSAGADMQPVIYNIARAATA
jgi:hypothetical protein